MRDWCAAHPRGVLEGYGSEIEFIDQNKKAPYVQQYSFDVNRELPGNLAVGFEYNGATGRNLGLEIALPSGSIQIVAYVRWVRATAETAPVERPAGAGVEFASPRPAEAEALRAQMIAGMSRFELR